MMKLNPAALPLKWKITISSAIIGIIPFSGSFFTQDMPPFSQKFLGLDLNFWIWSLFFGCVFAWSALWKKAYRSALIHFAAGSATYLLLNGYSGHLPAPLGLISALLLLVVPTMSVLFYVKTALTVGSWQLSRAILLQAYLSGLATSIILYYFPRLLFDPYLPNTHFIEAPLFYLLFYRICEGKQWQALFLIRKIARGKFVALFLLCWSLLMLGLYRLSSVLPYFPDLIGQESEAGDLFYSLALSLQTSVYLGLTILILGYACTQLLACWHLRIKKPLGWLYLLSFVPIVNIFTLFYLLKQQTLSWNSPERRHEQLEEARNNLGVGLLALTLIGALISVVLTATLNYQATEGGLYNSLLLSALSAAAIFALYNGWASYWPVAAVYVVVYGAFLIANPFASPEYIASALVVRCLGLLIYYQAIKPSACKFLQQALASA